MKFIEKVTNSFGTFGYCINGMLYRIINESPSIGDIVATKSYADMVIAASAFAKAYDEGNNFEEVYHVVCLTAWGSRKDGYAVVEREPGAEWKIYSSTGSFELSALKRMAELARCLNK